MIGEVLVEHRRGGLGDPSFLLSLMGCCCRNAKVLLGIGCRAAELDAIPRTKSQAHTIDVNAAVLPIGVTTKVS